MRRILITGGAGFVGSHAAEFYARKGWEVVVYDNLSRDKLLKRNINGKDFNWNYLKQFSNVTLIKNDILDYKELLRAMEGVDAVIHAAAQTAVTVSVTDPVPDFQTNAIGTFNVLEAARNTKSRPVVIYCSTNKVYGENVNHTGTIETESRYEFSDGFKNGIPENLSIDHCEHTPYGCSKLTGDLYTQDYAHLYGMRTGVFRMSCIYGSRQFGVEDQGWIAWFVIATFKDEPIRIDGDGKQVRDVLYVEDLIEAFDKFIHSNIQHCVINIGGGKDNSIPILHVLKQLYEYTGKRSEISFHDWRPSDQKIYISDISKAENLLGWKPCINVNEGIKKLTTWVQNNIEFL
ncbi:GDP-mannose 4,6-dehydratase [bacterium]|nr:GDP-mannose 4,6-dehydratase [bacterium]